MQNSRIFRAMTALVVCLAGIQVAFVTPASAAALTNVSWSASKAHPSDASVRYTYSFTKATTESVSTVTFTVPAGTAGASLTVVDYYGISVGTAALAGTTVTYTVTVPASIAAGTPILISIDGFTNTATPGTYSSTVTAASDSAASNSVTFDSNTTALTVVIARTISFSNNTDTILLLMDPSLSALTDRSHATTSLVVATNANNGYTLAAKATALTSTTGGSIVLPTATADVNTGVASGSFPTNTWGFAVPAPTSGGASGATLSRATELAADKYVGHTTSNQTIVTQTKPTNGDTVPVTTRAKIDYLQAALTYTSTITYTATPSY